MATEDDVYDVVLTSSSYLYASGEFSRRRTVEIDKFDLDASVFTTCCVVEMTWVNMTDSYKNFGCTVAASTDTFWCQQSSLTMLWGWWDHAFYVYQLCTWLCICRDVRRRTTSYAVWTPLSYRRLSCWVVLLQILLDNTSNPTFDDIKLSNESINKDIVLSPDKAHLYALTNSTVWSFSLL